MLLHMCKPSVTVVHIVTLSEGKITMNVTQVRCAVDRPADGDRVSVRTPVGFALVGYGRADLVDGPGEGSFIVDAHGMRLPNGTAITICETGERDPHVRVWESPEAAADDHGSFIVYDRNPDR